MLKKYTVICGLKSRLLAFSDMISSIKRIIIIIIIIIIILI